MIAGKYQQLLDRCTGKVPRPHLKPKPLTRIEKQHLEALDSIQDQYHNFFEKQERN